MISGFSAEVTVILLVPIDKPVTNPFSSIVAIDSLSEVQVTVLFVVSSGVNTALSCKVPPTYKFLSSASIWIPSAFLSSTVTCIDFLISVSLAVTVIVAVPSCKAVTSPFSTDTISGFSELHVRSSFTSSGDTLAVNCFDEFVPRTKVSIGVSPSYTSIDAFFTLTTNVLLPLPKRPVQLWVIMILSSLALRPVTLAVFPLPSTLAHSGLEDFQLSPIPVNDPSVSVKVMGSPPTYTSCSPKLS